MKALKEGRDCLRAFAMTASLATACSTWAQNPDPASADQASCPNDESGLQLPPGFCATIFADDIGHARHLAVAPNGVVYVNTWSGRYYGRDKTREDPFIVALQDTRGSGKADVQQRFGETVQSGGAGGTGIAIHGDALFVEINDRIVRYRLPSAGSIVPQEPAETVISDLPLSGDHPMHPFAIDADGHLYIDIASATNACQEKNRAPRSPGLTPCTELETRAGIWRYDAKKTNQKFSPRERYATGIRNAGGIAIDASGRGVYATQHGRDQLSQSWPDLYTPEQGATLPAEVLLKVQQGSDYGWPECYHDPFQQKLVLAPEYGGDGGKSVGACAGKLPAVAAFPAHWAPNALLLYHGDKFPARYRNGAFIAFHGSWNRAPLPQAGFNVVFQSLAPGREGVCEIFADGFAGDMQQGGRAAQRPAGLALAPDGALFISDDVRGRIYRVVYRGDARTADAPGIPCASFSETSGATAATARSTPERTPVAPDVVALPVAPEATRDMVVLGESIYRSQGPGAICAGCHGADARGTEVGPDLTDEKWLSGDGSFAAIARAITEGVMQPKEYRAPMPPFGGAQLSSEQVSALAAYLWGLSHRTAAAATAIDAAKAVITIPGERIFPESITSTTNGDLFIGSLGTRTIFRARKGADVAETWIQPQIDSAQGIFGVFADEGAKTLWTCVSGIGAGGASQPAELHAFDLNSGKPRGRYPFPTAGGLCNDIAVGADGSVYATDTRNMEIVRLAPRARALEVWAGGEAFGPKGGVLDGIAVLRDRVLVNTLATARLFSVAIERSGKAGAVAEVKLDRPVQRPDGMRSFGTDSLLLIESGSPGRLSRIDLSGNSGTVTTLQEGFPGGPVAVTVVGADAYVLEGQLAGMARSGPPALPFRALAFRIGGT